MSLGPQGFPKKLRAVHKYVTSYVHTAATASDVYQMTCNGLYDPDITSIGHQPLYFDQLSGIYNHYTVFKSTCIYKLMMTSVPCLVAHYIEDDTTVSTGTQAAEMSTSTTTVHSQIAVRPTVLSRTWVAKDFFGGDIFDNDLLQGNTTNNPQEQMYFTFNITAMDGVSLPAYTLLIEVLYEAVWDELKTIAQS
jgi:hypothetical protein